MTVAIAPRHAPCAPGGAALQTTVCAGIHIAAPTDHCSPS